LNAPQTRGNSGPNLESSGQAIEPPIGYVDSPPPGEFEANNAVRVEGWALDKFGILKITIEREPRPGDVAGDLNGRRLIPVGDAVILNGARPDVSEAFPEYPNLHRACWSFELRREAISQNDAFRVSLHVIAHNINGLITDLGRREIAFAIPDAAAPYLFCGRPFDSVFIEANGDVNPYPDCRPSRPFGSLLEPNATLELIWFGAAFTELRRKIINRDPPPMCLTCAHFINRNVNDSHYFESR